MSWSDRQLIRWLDLVIKWRDQIWFGLMAKMKSSWCFCLKLNELALIWDWLFYRDVIKWRLAPTQLLTPQRSKPTATTTRETQFADSTSDSVSQRRTRYPVNNQNFSVRCLRGRQEKALTQPTTNYQQFIPCFLGCVSLRGSDITKQMRFTASGVCKGTPQSKWKFD
jgi:hypothetical protein